MFKTADTVHISSFVRRQTKESPYTHWNFDDKTLFNRLKHFNKMYPGYRTGVEIVEIDPAKVHSSQKTLVDGDVLIGKYSSRQPGEAPRKSYYVRSPKLEARSCFVVLYHHDVLKEKNENESECDWEVVAVLASSTADPEPPPMDPDTLIANHFELSGGTATKMSSDDFVAALKQSVLYWKDRAMCEQDK